MYCSEKHSVGKKFGGEDVMGGGRKSLGSRRLWWKNRTHRRWRRSRISLAGNEGGGGNSVYILGDTFSMRSDEDDIDGFPERENKDGEPKRASFRGNGGYSTGEDGVIGDSTVKMISFYLKSRALLSKIHFTQCIL